MRTAIVLLALAVYLLIGVFVDAFFVEEWEKHEPYSLIVILFWPIVIVGFCMFKVIDIVFNLGRKVKEIFKK